MKNFWIEKALDRLPVEDHWSVSLAEINPDKWIIKKHIVNGRIMRYAWHVDDDK